MSENGTEAPDTGTDENTPRGLSRRHVVIGGLAGLGAGVAGGYFAGSRLPAESATTDPAPALASEGEPVPARGERQPGVTRPTLRQAHALMVVGNLAVLDPARASATSGEAVNDAVARDALRGALEAAGARIVALCEDPGDTAVTPDGPADLTVTVGLGDLPLSVSSAPEVADLIALPEFRDDASIDPALLGGDVYLSVNASDPGVLDPVMSEIARALGGVDVLWSQFGVRGVAEPSDGTSRNPFGYHDGIAQPRSDEDLDTNVWIADGPLAGGTICVVRRFALDTSGFAELGLPEQDAIMGRERATGVPLSGGERLDDVNLLAKDATGEYLTPAGSHARAAHPSFTGSTLMLRRSYNFVAGPGASGHVFVSFSTSSDAFGRTMVRMEEVDDLVAYMRADAGGAFAILPGVTEQSPLGATLFR